MWQVLLIVLLVFGLWAASIPVLSRLPYEAPADLAALGDSFGMINSLFSALALAGVVLSLYYQHRDFTQAHEEMRESSDALRQSAIAQREQVEAQKIAQEKLARLLEDQIDALRRQQNEAAINRFLQKADARFARWQETRAACGGTDSDCTEYFEARAGSDETLIYSVIEAKRGSGGLTFAILEADYMAQFRHLMLSLFDPVFLGLSADEQDDFCDDFHLRLRSILTVTEKKALLDLFPLTVEELKAAADETEKQKERMQLLSALARVNALKGLSSERDVKDTGCWKTYGRLREAKGDREAAVAAAVAKETPAG